MSDSSVPAIAFTRGGLVVPPQADILAGIIADLNAAFGGNLNPALETPQGQIASSLTAILGDAYAAFGAIVNQVNPDFADGFMQDAIARIYLLNRKPAQPTAVQCNCVGLQGTVIPIGAQAQASDGTLYICTGAGTIPVGGSISLSFAAQQNGPIICPAHTVTGIYQAIPGWDTIDNPSDGVPGTNVESRADFAYRRQQSVALNAHGSLPSIYAAVFDVANVLDVYATENTTNSPITVGATGYTLAPHSLYVAAVGGSSAAIAQAIWTKKNEGSDYNGNTSVDVIDNSGYNYPYPTYTVKFEIPASVPIKFAVEIANNPSLPSNIVDLVKAAIVSAFVGGDGGARARIASTIFASRYYGPITAINPAVEILSVLVGLVTPTLNSVAMGIDQFPTVTLADIGVTLI